MVEGAPLAAAQGRTSTAGDVRITIRPERIDVGAAADPRPNCLQATVDALVYLGSTTQVHLRLPSGTGLQALVQNTGGELPYREGDSVRAHLPAEALRVLIDSPHPAPEPVEE